MEASELALAANWSREFERKAKAVRRGGRLQRCGVAGRDQLSQRRAIARRPWLIDRPIAQPQVIPVLGGSSGRDCDTPDEQQDHEANRPTSAQSSHC